MAEPVEDIPTYAHEQIDVTLPGGTKTHVDVQLAVLLQALWNRGITTEWSCQGGDIPGSRSQQGGSAMASMFTTPWLIPHVGGAITESMRSDAHIVFAKYFEAQYFLQRSVELIDADPDAQVRHGWSMALKAIAPHPEGSHQWRGDVIWHHELTPLITEAWAGMPVRVDVEQLAAELKAQGCHG